MHYCFLCGSMTCRHTIDQEPPWHGIARPWDPPVFFEKENSMENEKKKYFILADSRDRTQLGPYSTEEEAKQAAYERCSGFGTRYYVLETIAMCERNEVTWTNMR